MISSILHNFAEYSYEIVYTEDVSTLSSSTWMMIMLLAAAVFIIMIAATWKIFTKAGRPGWAALVPIYNTLQIIWMTGKPWWWILLLMIPFVNIVFYVLLLHNTAKVFGKGVGYTLLLIFLPVIGYPMLAWGSAKYTKPAPSTSVV